MQASHALSNLAEAIPRVRADVDDSNTPRSCHPVPGHRYSGPECDRNRPAKENAKERLHQPRDSARPSSSLPEARVLKNRQPRNAQAGSKYQLEYLLGVAANDLASIFVGHRYRIDPVCRIADRLERIVRGP
jgi:hypothetical protein